MPTLADVFRAYVKPSMKGLLVIRKKTVNRISGEVVKRNAAFTGVMGGSGGAVVKCRGKPWDAFIACLKDQAKTLGTGASKTREYRRKFWRHPG